MMRKSALVCFAFVALCAICVADQAEAQVYDQKRALQDENHALQIENAELKAKVAVVKAAVPAKQLASILTAAVVTRCPGESPARVLAGCTVEAKDGNADPAKQLEATALGERGGYGSYGGSSGSKNGGYGSKTAAKAEDSGAPARCDNVLSFGPAS